MAGNLRDFAENKLLDHILGKTSYSMPTTYVGLHTSDPGEAGAGAEVSGNNYSRQALATAAASSGSAATNADISFPIASGSWGTITHVSIHDASSGGNMLWYGPLSASKAIASGDQLVVASGDLTFSLD